MKAAHIHKVRQRVQRAQDMLVGGGIENRELWTSRLALIIGQIRGRDAVTKKEARAASDAVWLLLTVDVPGVCDALIEANQVIHQQMRQLSAMHLVLRENGIDLSQLEPHRAKLFTSPADRGTV